jgi:hypothetical protein
MTEHWPDPVAIGGEALLHFLLPEQGLFAIGASEATLANGAVRSLLEKAEENDGLHDLENGVESLAAR